MPLTNYPKFNLSLLVYGSFTPTVSENDTENLEYEHFHISPFKSFGFDVGKCEWAPTQEQDTIQHVLLLTLERLQTHNLQEWPTFLQGLAFTLTFLPVFFYM